MMTDGEDIDFADLDFLLLPQNCVASENANYTNYNQISWEQNTENVCKQSSDKVDELVKQIMKSAEERQMLEQRLQEFQQRAEDIRQLYEEEKRLRQEYCQKHEEAVRKYASVDHDLVIKTLEVEQLRARCAEIKPPPAEYKLLVGKYIKLAQILSEMRLLQYHDQTLLKQLQKYCQEKGIKIPENKIPKSPRKKNASVETAEKEVQCDLVQQMPVVRKVNASTQYISTVTTRGTNTNIIRKLDVGTMHGSPLSETLPEDLPTVDIMMHELLQYDISHRSFLSPLKEFINIPQPIKISAGTCTDLCNIKRNIEFVKPQIETKIAETQTTKTADNNAINNGQSLEPQLFNKLWNTFGCMVYALMSDEKQRNQDALLEEKFSNTMGFTKETLKSWLSQACGLPSFPTNTLANSHFSTWNGKNYSDFKFNKSIQDIPIDKQAHNFTVDADIECMETLSNEIIVLEDNEVLEKTSKNRESSKLATKEKKRLKHLKKCTQKNEKLNKERNELNKSVELQCENLNDTNCEMERIVSRSTSESQTEFAQQEVQTGTNITQFVNLSDKSIELNKSEASQGESVKEKRKNLQKNELETESKKRRLTKSMNTFEEFEEIMPINCENMQIEETQVANETNEPETVNEAAKSMPTFEESDELNSENAKEIPKESNELEIINACNKEVQNLKEFKESKQIDETQKSIEFYEETEEEMELNCESPKLVIDLGEEQIDEESNEAENINTIEEATAAEHMIDECVKNMSEAFENNEFEKLRDSELQDVLIQLFGNENDVCDDPPSEIATDKPECAMEIAEPDEPDQLNELHVPKEIPLELKVSHESNNKRHTNCLMYQLIRNYSTPANTFITGQMKKYIPSSELRANIIAYIKSEHINKEIDIEAQVFKNSEHLKTIFKCKQIAKVIVQYVRDLGAEEGNLQDNKNMQVHILEIISVMQRKAQIFKTTLITELEQTIFNPLSKAEKLDLHQILNLTALYLLIEKSFEVNPYSARLFIAKTLYYFNALATPITFMVLSQHPTALPYREDYARNAMDPLVNVMQHILMSNKYDMDNKELQHRELLSKLRFEYHYEPFQPDRNTVLNVILTNLQTQRDLQKIPYALALLAKRLNPELVVKDIIQAKLLPLINSWRVHDEFSERLAVVLDCLSVLIKPFPLQTDVSVYLSIFAQFLNAANKNLKESAVRAILRLQRFGYVNCFNSLLTLHTDTSEFQRDTIAMLRTFIHRKPLNFWQNVCPDVFSV